jgi:hypothetical protein
VTEATATFAQVLQILATHVFFNSVIGINLTSALPWISHAAVQAAALIYVGLLVVVSVRRRHRALLCLLYLAAVTVLLSFLFPLNNLTDFLDPRAGPRYYLFATLFVLCGTLLLCVRGGRLRWLSVPVAGAALILGIPGDFAHPRGPDTQWRDQVRVFESLPQGASFYAPVQPLYVQGVTMQRGKEAPKPPPLSGLRRMEGSPGHHFFAPSLSRNGGLERVKFHGWVANLDDGGESARVWLTVDGELYPAVVQEMALAGADRGRASGSGHTFFEREIPLSMVNVGKHRIGLLLPSRDSGTYSRTAEQVLLVR